MMEIYQMTAGPSGRKLNKTMIAQAERTSEGIRITCYDEVIKKELGEIFTSPIIKRVPTGPRTGLITHTNRVVEPFSDEFFSEVIFELSRRGFTGVIRQG